jgi:hypothetical protein
MEHNTVIKVTENAGSQAVAKPAVAGSARSATSNSKTLESATKR